jgi:hypothetical protein
MLVAWRYKWNHVSSEVGRESQTFGKSLGILVGGFFFIDIFKNLIEIFFYKNKNKAKSEDLNMNKGVKVTYLPPSQLWQEIHSRLDLL